LLTAGMSAQLVSLTLRTTLREFDVENLFILSFLFILYIPINSTSLSEFSDTQSLDKSQATSFLFQFTEDTPNRDPFKKHLVSAVFSRFRN
jgi:hypothetical protein